MTDPTQLSQQNAGAPADDEIDLGYLFGLLLDQKWLIIALTALFTLAGGAYALLATPVYQADALVHVEKRPSISPLGDLGDMLGQDADSLTSAEVRILSSRMVLGQVVDRLDLNTVVTPATLPLVGNALRRYDIERPGFMEGRASVWAGEYLAIGRFEVAEQLQDEPLTVESRGDGRYRLLMDGHELGDGRVGELVRVADGDIELRVSNLTAPPGAQFTLTKRNRAAAARSLATRVSVSETGGGSGMLNLTLTGTDPTEIKHSLDTVLEVFLLQNVDRQSAEAQQSLAFLEAQVPELRNQLATAEDRLNAYRVEMDSVDLASESRAAVEHFIDIERQLNELAFQEAELAQRYISDHPSYRALLRQKRYLEDERGELNQRVNQLPAAQQEVVRLTRDVEVTQAIYVSVLNKVQELQVVKAGTVGNVRIIDEALIGPGPIAPKKSLIVVLAALLGGMLSVGIVLVRGMLRRGVESPQQLEQMGLSVYATVPLSDAQQKQVKRIKRRREPRGNAVVAGVLAQQAPADTAVEALRGLRTSLHFAMLEATDKRLMITGPSPGIGKSFVSVNLAVVCAQAGQSVLVVDADMRKGHLHHVFGGSGEQGLSELLSGKAELDEVLRNSDVAGLAYMARGMIPPNPSELLTGQRFSRFLAQAEDRFDLVIIDTPPVLAVTDAVIVGRQCSTTLMVVRFGLNPLKEVQLAHLRLESGGVVSKGVILNAIERRAATSYGYGYYEYSYNNQ